MEKNIEKKYGIIGFVHHDIWWLILFAGIALLAFGIVLFLAPLIILKNLLIVYAIFACVFGAVSIIRGLLVVKRDKHWWILLIQGILVIGIGLLVFFWPVRTSVFLVYFLGAWLLIVSLTSLTRVSERKSPLVLVNGVLGIMLGIFIFFGIEFHAPMILLLIVGVFCILRGVSMITESIVIKKAYKHQ